MKSLLPEMQTGDMVCLTSNRSQLSHGPVLWVIHCLIVWSNANEKKSLNFFSHSSHTCTTNYNLNTSLQTAPETQEPQAQL